MKFVSLSQLLGCPLFGSNSGLFTVPGFTVSLVGIKKRKTEEEEGRKKRYKGKDRRNKTRKKEREEEGVKKIIIVIIIVNKELLLKKPPAGFKLAKPVLLVFLAATNSGGLAQLFFVLDQYSGSL